MATSTEVKTLTLPQVAYVLEKFSHALPCEYKFSEDKTLSDKFCSDELCATHTEYECWLHALAKGWLDDEISKR